MTLDAILRNDGSYVLRNDGFKILRNGVSAGVTISGQHSAPLIGMGGRPKPKVRKFELTATSKISRYHDFSAKARILRDVTFEAKGKITKLTEGIAKAKISRLHELDATSLTYSLKDDKQIAQHQKEDNIKSFLKESRIRKLRRMFDIYKDIE